MTKSREKLIKKAMKQNLSTSKIEYLSNIENTYPEYFYNTIFSFIKGHTDEELQNEGYQFLQNLYLNTFNRYTFSRTISILEYLDCPISKIIEYYNIIIKDDFF